MTKKGASISRKRPNTFENELEIAKKRKLEGQKLPNELWLKIINYLTTRDLINIVVLVCKNFYNLAKDVKYLELKDISELKFESAMKLLKTTKHLKEVSVSTRLPKSNNNLKNQLIIQALKSSKGIKSIKLQSFYGFLDSEEQIRSERSLGSFKRIKSYCKELEHLYLRDVTFGSNNVIFQIAQIKTLKSFKITAKSSISTWYGTFTPKTILEFSNNCPNLEAITFHIKYGKLNFNEMKNALDTFFSAKKHTLKSLDFINSYKSKAIPNVNRNQLLEKLHLCEHLEEISIRFFYLDDSTLLDILKLPKLKTLVLEIGTLSETQFWSLYQGHTLTNLKHLKLGYVYKKDNSFLNSFTFGFAQMKFPVLERFALDIVAYGSEINQEDCNTDALCQLIANAPKLKSIQLHGECFHNEAYRKFSEKICKERNIFITFGTLTHEVRWFTFEKYQEFQNDFEKLMAFENPVTKIKYDELKTNFLAWAKRNIWWSRALEDN